MAKAVKLADIAERVGVSTVTVSKALSGQKGVSEEVREKIHSIAEELGYQQPSAARKSQNQKSYNIGILISERFLDKYESFYWQMYQSVATRATAKECFTMLEVIGIAEEENGRLPKLVQERKVDGIIVIGKMMDDYLQHLNTEAGIPVIYLDYYNGREASDSVISNSYYGTYELTYYLYRMGHRKIAYVGTLLATESITDRSNSYFHQSIGTHCKIFFHFCQGRTKNKCLIIIKFKEVIAIFNLMIGKITIIRNNLTITVVISVYPTSSKKSLNSIRLNAVTL